MRVVAEESIAGVFIQEPTYMIQPHTESGTLGAWAVT